MPCPYPPHGTAYPLVLSKSNDDEVRVTRIIKAAAAAEAGKPKGYHFLEERTSGKPLGFYTPGPPLSVTAPSMTGVTSNLYL